MTHQSDPQAYSVGETIRRRMNGDGYRPAAPAVTDTDGLPAPDAAMLGDLSDAADALAGHIGSGPAAPVDFERIERLAQWIADAAGHYARHASL